MNIEMKKAIDIAIRSTINAIGLEETRKLSMFTNWRLANPAKLTNEDGERKAA